MSPNWINLTRLDELEVIKSHSFNNPVVIYKHSTRCNISGLAKSRLEGCAQLADEEYYYLDLISYREISNAIAEQFKVHHESPQILVIKNGECVYDESHMAITCGELKEQILS